MSFTPHRLLACAYAYFEWSDANPIIQEKLFQHQGEILVGETKLRQPFSLEAFYVHSGCSRTSWYRYVEKEEFREVIDEIKAIMHHQKLSGATVGVFNANIISRVLGLADVSKTTVEAVVKHSPEDYESARKAIGERFK
jgi:hypothetical protein